MMNTRNSLDFTPELRSLLKHLPCPVAVVDECMKIVWENGEMNAYRCEQRPRDVATLCETLGCIHANDPSEQYLSEKACRRCRLSILIKNTLQLRQQDAGTRFRLAVSKKRHRQLELFTTTVTMQQSPAVMLTFSDVTERCSRKHLLAEINRLTKALEATGSIGHKLAQPLMTISGYIQLLLMETDRDSSQYIRLEKINEQALRISSITQGLVNIRKRHTAADNPAATARHRHLTLL